jgi:hypothetical protein
MIEDNDLVPKFWKPFVNSLKTANLPSPDVYFYVNKQVWCEKYINFIKSELFENNCYLIVDTNDGIKLAGFTCVADFEESIKLIERLINHD